MPLKIIWGTNDDWIPVETAERLGKMLKAKEVVSIKDARHLVIYDQPACTARNQVGCLIDYADTL